MSRNGILRNKFSFLKLIKEVVKKSGTEMQNGRHIAEIRREIKALYSEDPLALPMTEEWRHQFSRDGELGVDYKIYPDIWKNDEEIQSFVDENIGYTPYYSQYDCTGRPFTYDKYWKRTPAGIVIIHRWGLDV